MIVIAASLCLTGIVLFASDSDDWIVSTKDGMVKLEGIVDNAAEKDLAGQPASDVHGVKSVSNNKTLN